MRPLKVSATWKREVFFGLTVTGSALRFSAILFFVYPTLPIAAQGEIPPSIPAPSRVSGRRRGGSLPHRARSGKWLRRRAGSFGGSARDSSEACGREHRPGLHER
jgi:hypothetical protein